MESSLRVLFVGDVVGEPGCAAACAIVPVLRHELALDAVVINAENSAPSGFGVTEETTAALLDVADFLTLGDHAFDQPESADLLRRETRIIRPANVEPDRPGRGWGSFTVGGVRVGVVTVEGRVFMRAVPESPFAAVDRALAALRQDGAAAILVEMHAEATSEKQAMGWHCAGRAALVVGTHTHVATADARILDGGTAYISDVGMTGGRDGIIGFERDGFLRFIADSDRSGMPLHPAREAAGLDGVLVVVDPATGRSLSIERIARATN